MWVVSLLAANEGVSLLFLLQVCVWTLLRVELWILTPLGRDDPEAHKLQKRKERAKEDRKRKEQEKQYGNGELETLSPDTHVTALSPLLDKEKPPKTNQDGTEKRKELERIVYTTRTQAQKLAVHRRRLRVPFSGAMYTP